MATALTSQTGEAYRKENRLKTQLNKNKQQNIISLNLKLVTHLSIISMVILHTSKPWTFTLMQESLWWWQCSDRYVISLFPHLHTPSPSLISLMVSVDVKYHAYFIEGKLQENRTVVYKGRVAIQVHNFKCCLSERYLLECSNFCDWTW